MKILGFNITRSAPPTPTTRSFTPEQWLRGDDLNGPGSVLSNAYQQVVWVYRAINALAEQVANVPFLFSAGERGRETLITSGPLQKFYDQPHPNINRFQYWELRIMWLMLRGECFRIPIFESSSSSSSIPSSSPHRNTEAPKHRRRRLSRVLILDPAHFHHIVHNNQLVGWRYTGLGPNAPLSSQVLLPEEVWFEKLPNPFDFWRGMPPLYVAETAAKTDYAAGCFMKGLIENNADLGVIVRTDQQLDDAQQQQILADLRNRKRQAGTADKPLLLWSGAEVIKPQLSSADMQFLDNRKFSRSEICAAFGVPEEIITTTDKAKYDVMAGARLNFIENRVVPLCARLEAEENATTIPALVPSYSSSLARHSLGEGGSSIPFSRLHSTLNSQPSTSVVGWFDTDSLPIMQEARRARLAAVKTGFDMGIPFNELNRVFDLGFKSLPWGNTGYLKTNLSPIGSLQSSSSSSS